MGAYIIFCTSSLFSQTGPLTVKLAALEQLKSPERLIMAIRLAIVARWATCLKVYCGGCRCLTEEEVPLCLTDGHMPS